MAALGGGAGGVGGAAGAAAGGAAAGKSLSHSDQDAIASYNSILKANPNMDTDGWRKTYEKMSGYRKRQLKKALQLQGLWEEVAEGL